jgi:S1-C subfamily serine protease
VGFPFFAQFKMTIDYQKKSLTLTPNGYKVPPGLMESLTKLIMEGPKDQTLAPSAQWGIVCTKDKGDEDDGVDVKAVVPGGAAEKAGMKKGDRLLTLDGRWTDSMKDLFEAAGYVKPGRTVKVKVKRDGKEVELKVTPNKGM